MTWSITEWYGGAVGEDISADRTIFREESRVFTFDPQVGGLDVVLPDLATLPDGWFCVIVNEHATNSFTIKDSDDTPIQTADPEVSYLFVSDGTAWRLLKTQALP